ncbi:MAG TPA: MBL fold metallo-hydrolase [Geobacteraceae bacterium]
MWFFATLYSVSDERRSHFRFLEPTFCSGLLDDPVLYLFVRPLGKALLFDCGQIHHLAKRVVKSVVGVFITHAHMDHFMGIDTLVRHNHVAPKTIDVFGPPGIARRMAGKFSGYEWNLTEPYWCSFRVHEIHDRKIVTHLFPGPEGFVGRFLGESPRTDRVIYRNEWVQVEANVCDHRIPALIFRVTEREAFAIDEEKLAAEGYVKGEWVRLLKKHFYGAASEAAPLLAVKRQGERSVDVVVENPMALYEAIRKRETPASIGYVTDVAFSEDNIARIVGLLQGVTLLVCECSFLAGDRGKARLSSHLCTDDVTSLLDRLSPLFVLPMHLSKTYIGRTHLLYDELRVPSGMTLLRLPDRFTSRPFLPEELCRLTRALARKE